MSQRKIFIAIVLSSTLIFLASLGAFIRDRRRVIQLTLATGSQTGVYYPFGVAIAQTIAQHQPKIDIQVIQTNGSRENMQLLESGEVELAIAQSDTPTFPAARAISILYAELFHLIATQSSQIETIADLKGKRIALMPEGSGSYDAFWTVANHYNLKQQDFQIIEITPEEALKTFHPENMDAIFRVQPVGNTWTRKLLQKTEGNLIAIDQAAAMKILIPYLDEGIIPKGTYQALPPVPDLDIEMVGVQATLLTHKNIKPEIIREIAEILYEYRYDLVKLEPRAAAISPPNVGNNVGLPLHPGARSYFEREKPSFLTENAELFAFILSIFTVLFSATWSLRSAFFQKQKNRADRYNLQILKLTEAAQTIDDLEQLQNLRSQLFTIFRKVVEDLDLDRITPESFQSFSFTWEAAINTIHHRELIALSKGQKITGD